MKLSFTAGDPTPEDIAAVTAAVLGLAATHTSDPSARTAHAWGRAARLEAIGQAPFSSSADPRLGIRRSGALPPSATD